MRTISHVFAVTIEILSKLVGSSLVLQSQLLDLYVLEHSTGPARLNQISLQQSCRVWPITKRHVNGASPQMPVYCPHSQDLEPFRNVFRGDLRDVLMECFLGGKVALRPG
jgi:hypothetical protein